MVKMIGHEQHDTVMIEIECLLLIVDFLILHFHETKFI